MLDESIREIKEWEDWSEEVEGMQEFGLEENEDI